MTPFISRNNTIRKIKNIRMRMILWANPRKISSLTQKTTLKTREIWTAACKKAIFVITIFKTVVERNNYV